MRNLPEFKALIKRYESITLEEIVDGWDNFLYDSTVFTGFGRVSACTLCTAVELPELKDYDLTVWKECHLCVYGKPRGCISDDNLETYDAIYESSNPKELLTAFRNRAKRMREILTIKNITL